MLQPKLSQTRAKKSYSAGYFYKLNIRAYLLFLREERLRPLSSLYRYNMMMAETTLAATAMMNWLNQSFIPIEKC